MVEITPTEMNLPADDSREFRPMRGISNRHLQTMLPRLIRRKVKFDAHWQRLELPTATLSIWHGVKIRIRRSTNRVWWFFTVWKVA